MNKKTKVYCNYCTHLRKLGIYQITQRICFAIQKKVDTYLKETTEYGNPEVLNKNNNCKLFAQKPPSPTPTWWERNGTWVLPLSIILFVAICVTFICVFMTK